MSWHTPPKNKETEDDRAKVVRHIGRLGGRSVGPLLAAILEDDGEPTFVRAVATEQLARLGLPASQPVLLKMLSSAPEIFRPIFLVAVGRANAVQGDADLKPYFKHEDATVRRNAAVSARHLADEGSEESLLYMAKSDPDEQTRTKALDSLLYRKARRLVERGRR